MKKYSIPLLIAAAVLGIAYVSRDYGKNYAVVPNVNSPLAIAYCWMMCLALIGSMKRWGDKSSAAGRFLAKRSFGLYVFHYLTLSACAYFLTTYTDLPGVALYLLTAIAAFGGAFVLNAVISRIPVIRWCVLGIKREDSHVS